MSDMKQQNRLYLIIYVAALLMLSGQLITGCSSTSALKEDEQLFKFSLYSLKTVLFSVSVQKSQIKIYHKILQF